VSGLTETRGSLEFLVSDSVQPLNPRFGLIWLLALSEAVTRDDRVLSGAAPLSVISAGDLPFVPSHFSKSKTRTPCSTSGCWTLTVIVCPRPICPTHALFLNAASACAMASFPLSLPGSARDRPSLRKIPCRSGKACRIISSFVRFNSSARSRGPSCDFWAVIGA
jgi:hypothetical protein